MNKDTKQILLIAGLGVGGYFAYNWWQNRQAAQAEEAAYYPGAYGGGYGALPGGGGTTIMWGAGGGTVGPCNAGVAEETGEGVSAEAATELAKLALVENPSYITMPYGETVGVGQFGRYQIPPPANARVTMPWERYVLGLPRYTWEQLHRASPAEQRKATARLTLAQAHAGPSPAERIASGIERDTGTFAERQAMAARALARAQAHAGPSATERAAMGIERETGSFAERQAMAARALARAQAHAGPTAAQRTAMGIERGRAPEEPVKVLAKTRVARTLSGGSFLRNI